MIFILLGLNVFLIKLFLRYNIFFIVFFILIVVEKNDFGFLLIIYGFLLNKNLFVFFGNIIFFFVFVVNLIIVFGNFLNLLSG